ncbi:hypothetical protein KEM52_001943, partial [Ascosphaera acerosa]
LDAWLRAVLWDRRLPAPLVEAGEEKDGPSQAGLAFDVHRLKGLVPLADGSCRVVQGVRELFEIVDAAEAPAQPLTQGKIVVIGRGLDDGVRAAMQDSLLQTLAASEEQLR